MPKWKLFFFQRVGLPFISQSAVSSQRSPESHGHNAVSSSESIRGPAIPVALPESYSLAYRLPTYLPRCLSELPAAPPSNLLISPYYHESKQPGPCFPNTFTVPRHDANSYKLRSEGEETLLRLWQQSLAPTDARTLSRLNFRRCWQAEWL